MSQELAYILVGDHLGQVKKVLWPSGEISLLSNLTSPTSSNPIVSIEPIFGSNKQLIANKNGQIYVYDCIKDETKECQNVDSDLIKAISLKAKSTNDNIKILYVYEKQVVLEKEIVIKNTNKDLKRGVIKNAAQQEDRLAIVGKDIPLKLYDINKMVRIFDSDPPEKNWLGIRPETFVSGVDFLGNNTNRLATCSKSDSVIRVYDLSSKLSKPVISIDINQTAFNEHADAARFISISSTNQPSLGHNSLVIGSNVGQMLAIDIRFNVKQITNKKKKLQPKQYKVLGGFKGSRGATIKDIKIIPNVKSQIDEDDVKDEDDEDDYVKVESGHKVISCSLDRYLRIHNFTKTSRHLDKHVYMTTKPLCCSPVFYNKT